ncbi:hypothetical protein AB0383_20330 [Amycolatopsis sp. NPDC051373]|uniref:hypothetical protein n=1 Tax=Amycolatopsis sp. NPDC051373 TaxID=3155801 RepID=UPI003450A878
MSEVQTFRKKPVEIQAMRWDGTASGATPVIEWVLGGGSTVTYRCVDDEGCQGHDSVGTHVLKIETLEGPITASPGDWVIRGVQGEFYPCKPDIFAATYDEV